jgi:hypothetical protein
MWAAAQFAGGQKQGAANRGTIMSRSSRAARGDPYPLFRGIVLRLGALIRRLCNGTHAESGSVIVVQYGIFLIVERALVLI